MTVRQIRAVRGKNTECGTVSSTENTSGRNELSGVLLYCDTAVEKRTSFSGRAEMCIRNESVIGEQDED